jgi:chromosome segregation ATPase
MMKLPDAVEAMLPLAQAIISFKDNMPTLSDLEDRIAKAKAELVQIDNAASTARSTLTELTAKVETAKADVSAWNERVIQRRRDHDQVLTSMEALQKRLAGQAPA